MNKIKIVLGASMVVAMFAFTAAPALARWTNHGGKGEGKAGEGTFTYEGGSIKCASATGRYKVNSEGTVMTGEATKFNSCKGLGLEATISCTTAEGKQPNKEGTENGKATGALISKECLVKVGEACELSFPTAGNTELKTISMKKSGLNVEADAEITGITGTAKGSGCALGGIMKEKTTVATIKIPSGVAEDVGLE